MNRDAEKRWDELADASSIFWGKFLDAPDMMTHTLNMVEAMGGFLQHADHLIDRNANRQDAKQGMESWLAVLMTGLMDSSLPQDMTRNDKRKFAGILLEMGEVLGQMGIEFPQDVAHKLSIREFNQKDYKAWQQARQHVQSFRATIEKAAGNDTSEYNSIMAHTNDVSRIIGDIIKTADALVECNGKRRLLDPRPSNSETIDKREAILIRSMESLREDFTKEMKDLLRHIVPCAQGVGIIEDDKLKFSKMLFEMADTLDNLGVELPDDFYPKIRSVLKKDDKTAER